MTEEKLVNIPAQVINSNFSLFQPTVFGKFENTRQCFRCQGVVCEDVLAAVTPSREVRRVWTITTRDGQKELAEIPAPYKRCSLRAAHIEGDGIQITLDGIIHGYSRRRNT